MCQAVGYRNQLLLRMGGTLRARRDISLEILRTLGGPSTERVVGVRTDHFMAISWVECLQHSLLIDA